MNIFEKRKTRFWNQTKILFPAILLIILCLGFMLSINRTSQETLLKQEQTLIQALNKGAIHTYSLEGRYPENLEKLLKDYNITYDSKKFVVEYIPNGANLFPSISVLPLTQPKGDN